MQTQQKIYVLSSHKNCGRHIFFTLVTYQRKQLFNNPENIHFLREAIRRVKITHPFDIDAFVLLPDHLHCIWTLPQDDDNFSTRWRLIKSYFTRACEKNYKISKTVSRVQKKEQCIWQRRFWEHQIRDEEDFINHVEYIHYNPVKHGYVQSPCDWQYSSFSRFVKSGIYPNDWGSSKKTNFSDRIGRE